MHRLVRFVFARAAAPTAVLVVLLLLLQLFAPVSGQSGCSSTQPIASALAAVTSCSCPYEPFCYCDDLEGGMARCANGCEYCNTKGTICGWFSVQAYDHLTGGEDQLEDISTAFQYIFTFTKGRSGSVTYIEDYDTNVCGVWVNNKRCASCRLSNNKCRLSGKREPTFDCTRLVKGLAGTACTRRAAGGWLSLNNSALNTVGQGFIMPYLQCANGNAFATPIDFSSSPSSRSQGGNATSPLRLPKIVTKETIGKDKLPFDIFSLLEGDEELLSAELVPAASTVAQSENGAFTSASGSANAAVDVTSPSATTSAAGTMTRAPNMMTTTTTTTATLAITMIMMAVGSV